jgi:hypothetical protein
MAEPKKRTTKKRILRKKPSRAKAAKGAKARRAGKAAEAESSPSVAVSAAKKLRSAVDSEVSKSSKKIAKAMVEQAVKGNMSGARLLIELSGAKNPPEEEKKKCSGPTQAELLASEPQWEGESDEDRRKESHCQAQKSPTSPADSL